jgi:hypothetical protein
MIRARRLSRRLVKLAFEGEQVTPSQGGDYASHADISPVCLRSRSRRYSVFSADRFSDAISISPEHEFTRRKQYQTEHWQGELHQQRNLCE